MLGSVVDLFCGVGGLSYGFAREGFSVVVGVDSDESCQYAYETNIGAQFIAADVRKLRGKKLAALFPEDRQAPRILIGCAPCQPFSIYTGRYKKARRRDVQWKLLEEFARIVRATRPDVVSMENVARVARHRVFKAFQRDLTDIGYTVSVFVAKAHDYGVPQRRSRLILFASRHGRVNLIEPTHHGKPRTVRDAIGHLPAVRAGEVSPGDRLHRARNLTEINKRRLRAAKPGGFWSDWDDNLRLECHRKGGGKSFRSVYGRMRWQEPSPVITTQCLGIGNGRFGHPSQMRAISIREAALLQSFPARYRFVEPDAAVVGVTLARQIGNAVPPKLGRIIARSIKRHLSQVTLAEPSR